MYRIEMSDVSLRLADIWGLSLNFTDEIDIFRTYHCLSVSGPYKFVELWCRIFVSASILCNAPVLGKPLKVYQSSYLPNIPTVIIGITPH